MSSERHLETTGTVVYERSAESQVLGGPPEELPYKEIFHNSPTPMWVFDVETLRFLTVNQAALTAYGYSREEFLRLTVYDIRPPEEIPRLRALLTQRRPAFSAKTRWVHQHKNGQLRTVDIISHEIVLRGRRARLVVVQDLTEREASDAALRESEARFQLVAQATSDAIWDWDVATDRVWWSNQFLAHFGYPPSEMEPVLRFWSERIHPEDRGSVIAGLHNLLEGTGGSWAAEYRFCRKDGTYAHVRDRGHVLRDEEGRPRRLVSGMSDVTEHKKLETRFLRAQRLESIGTLAGGIAHDLNNVLAPILISIELLKLNVGDEQSLNLLQTIQSSAERGASLVRQVLTFARGLDGRHVPIKLELLIGEVVRICEETFPRSISVVFSRPRKLWSIAGDATQLQQVLLNLAVNARDAMNGGPGELRFAADNCELAADCPFLGSHPAGPHVVIQVSDTGIGIPPENRERIFDPFFTTKPIGQGTGLGLATAQAIVREHRGLIRLESEVGRGTTFSVYLPADPQAEVPPAASEPQADLPRGAGEWILVVDDESSILHITQRTLEAFGYQIRIAHHGAEALDIFRAHAEIAVVLTDLVMPNMDGPSAIHALREIRPGVAIIATSGLASQDRVTRMLDPQIDQFLAKPFTAEKLLHAVRQAVKTKRVPSSDQR